ncbi:MULTISPECIES: MauE/DoxX family redox-associated membrane protein [Arthrobacter]|uniref:MauE/DoxX family redox-associated membrane protein n=2 Tax=Arthrobacter TaxID=1663 RepID=A0ABU9KLF9_9MICC|nr:MauE/DoxX family redox-associated membrane protein [Arthrobacter sp. YJM1]MDP5227736.1 hypothetical protein [Arthrobacter sp. YJM1]
MNPIVQALALVAVGFIAFLLVFSGASKFAAPSTFESSLTSLKFRGLLPSVLTWAIPTVEILIGLALIFTTAVPAALARLAAVVLFGAFTVFVGRTVRFGTTSSCGCFGNFSTEPMSSRTAWRNAVLTGVAIVSFAADLNSSSWLERALSDYGQLFLGTLFSLAAVAAVMLFVENRRLRAASVAEAAAGPAVLAPGDAVPAMDMVTGHGDVLSLERLSGGWATLLVFTAMNCGSCSTVPERMVGWKDRIGSTVAIKVAAQARIDHVQDAFPGVNRQDMLFGVRKAIAVLGMSAAPAAVLLGSDGKVGSPVVYGVEGIDALVRGIEEAQQAG